jgi:hypothetical protein
MASNGIHVLKTRDHFEQPVIFRRIVKSPNTPQAIKKSDNGLLFEKLKKCIYRKAAFLKTDATGDEYVDIETIFSQGLIVVSKDFKKSLGKLST